jgi:hypothetical protein
MNKRYTPWYIGLGIAVVILVLRAVPILTNIAHAPASERAAQYLAFGITVAGIVVLGVLVVGFFLLRGRARNRAVRSAHPEALLVGGQPATGVKRQLRAWDRGIDLHQQFIIAFDHEGATFWQGGRRPSIGLQLGRDEILSVDQSDAAQGARPVSTVQLHVAAREEEPMTLALLVRRLEEPTLPANANVVDEIRQALGSAPAAR